MHKKNFFNQKKNYNGEKEFSLTLRKLDGTPPKFYSDKIYISLVSRPKQNKTKKKH